jgi:hypothetical protein
MEIKTISKFAGKYVLLKLKDGQFLTVKLPNKIDDDLVLLDKYNKCVAVNINSIDFISEADLNDY